MVSRIVSSSSFISWLDEGCLLKYFSKSFRVILNLLSTSSLLFLVTFPFLCSIAIAIANNRVSFNRASLLDWIYWILGAIISICEWIL